MVGEDGRGMVWPDDVPAEVARQAQVRAVDGAAKKEPPKPVAAAAAPIEKEEPKAEAAKPKRVRTKRTPLAAVPDGEVVEAKKPSKPAARAPRVVEQEKPAPRPVVAPAPSSRPALGSTPNSTAKKKRELPPYLRVVK
jgi:hypothetical protein